MINTKAIVGDFKEFIIDKDDPLDLESLEGFINAHKNLVKERYEPLLNMYQGKHNILFDQPKPLNKPDNKVVMNFAKYIVDTLNGYFLGIPIKINHDSEDYINKLTDVSDYNNIDDEQYELAKDMSIFGVGYEMLYLDEEAVENILHVSPLETFVIRDNSIRKKVRYGVHYYKDQDGNLKGTFSDDEKIYYFEEGKDGLYISEEYPHYFGFCPIIEYRENEECQAAFESVYTLINQIDKVISEKANDVDYFADAYLKVVGVELTEEQVRFLKENRIWNLYKTTNEADGTIPDVGFLQKPDADQTQENLLNRLEEKIYQLSMVPNLSDENFGTSSGIALSYKLQGLDNLCKSKERKFTAGLNTRYKLLCNLPNWGDKEAYKGITYQFTRNAPKNVLEEAQVVNSLNGLVSKETGLSYLSIVDNAKEEIEKMKEEDEFDTDIKHDHGDDWSMEDVNDEQGILEKARVPKSSEIQE
ncbi:MAG: phage portal protein [Anaerococcus vaginalis]|nr:phage portal protein [Anaerococcus vaginalis]